MPIERLIEEYEATPMHMPEAKERLLHRMAVASASEPALKARFQAFLLAELKNPDTAFRPKVRTIGWQSLRHSIRELLVETADDPEAMYRRAFFGEEPAAGRTSAHWRGLLGLIDGLFGFLRRK